MSEQNLETVRRAYEAYNRRDIAAIQALGREDSIIYTAIEGRAEPQPFREGLRAWIENERAVWQTLEMADLELDDLGDDRIFTSAVARLRGKESGIELTVQVWSVFELRNGRIFRLRSYPDRAKALEAAGLRD